MFIRKFKNYFFIILLFGLLKLNLAFADDSFDQNPFQHLQKTDTLKIDLQEAILTALEHNPSLSIQRLQPKIAKSFVKEQGGIYVNELKISDVNMNIGEKDLIDNQIMLQRGKKSFCRVVAK